MEQLNQTPSGAEEVNTPTTENATPEAASTETSVSNQGKDTSRKNLLYEECLEFIPNTLKGRQDPRYVYAKFFKQYKQLHYTNEDFLDIIEEMGLLPQLQILQISKANKNTDVFFRREEAADMFVKRHILIRGKPIPFIRKAKRILRVTVKGAHPEVSNDMLLYELEPFIEHCWSIKHNEIHHRGTTFRDGTRRVFVTHLARHIPRSIKIGHRWCLVFYRGQPDLPERLAQQTLVIQITPPAETLPDQMDVGEPGPGTSSVDELSEATSDESGMSLQIVVDEPRLRPRGSENWRKASQLKARSLKKRRRKQTQQMRNMRAVSLIYKIVEELESSNFTNIWEVLRVSPNMEVERAVSTMVALVGSTKPEGDMPSNCRKFYREHKRMKEKNITERKLHEELKEEGFYPRFLSKLKLFGKNNPEQPPA